MKVVHVLKRIEIIDQDIKELKKLEKTVKGNKSFTTPIIMSIEKQINIILGERIKLLEMRIDNPPAGFQNELDGQDQDSELEKITINDTDTTKQSSEKTGSSRVKIKGKSEKASPKIKKSTQDLDDDDFVIPMLTQSQIDEKISSMKKDVKNEAKTQDNTDGYNSDSVKLLDIALEKGTIDKSENPKQKDRKIRFFRDNFPTE